MDKLEHLKNNTEIFFRFMKEKYPIFYNSNIFFRDVQYAVKDYFEKKDIYLKYPEAEKITAEFIKYLEKNNELVKLTSNSWKVNFSFINAVKETNDE